MDTLPEEATEHFGYKQDVEYTVFPDGIPFDNIQNIDVRLLAASKGHLVCSSLSLLVVIPLADLATELAWMSIPTSNVTQVLFVGSKLLVLQSGALFEASWADGSISLTKLNGFKENIKSFRASSEGMAVNFIDNTLLWVSGTIKREFEGVVAYDLAENGGSIAVATSTSVKIIDPDAETELLQPDEGNTTLEIHELSKGTFFVVLGPESRAPDDHDFTSIVVSKDGSKWETDVAGPWGADRVGTYYIDTLDHWIPGQQYSIITLAAATEISTIKTSNGVTKAIQELEDFQRAQFPLDDEGNDTSVVGIALDVDTKNIEVAQPASLVESATGLPRLWALTQTGNLLSWWVYETTAINEGAVDLPSELASRIYDPKEILSKFDLTEKQGTIVEKELEEKEKESIEKIAPKESSFGSKSENPFGNSTAKAFGNITSSKENSFGSSAEKSAFGSAFGSSGFGSKPDVANDNEIKPPSSGASIFDKSAQNLASLPTESGKATFGSSGFGNTSGKPAFGSSGFGSSSEKPAFGATSFGSSSEKPAFGSSGFGSSSEKPAFGATSFGSSSEKPAFGSSGFGSSSEKPAFGATSFGSSSDKPAFGSSGFGNTSEKPAFGATSFGSSEKPAFGSSGFGSSSDKPAFGTTSFGSSSDKPAFGATSFGSSSDKPAFGTTSFGSSSEKPAFGATSFGSSSEKPALGSSGFGSSSGKPAFGTSSFGSSEKPAFGATSLGSSEKPAFGATSFGSTSTKSAFGSSGFGSGPTSLQPSFGSSSFGQNGQSLFSKFSQGNENGASPFGSSQEKKESGSIFGSGSAFGAKKQEGSIFGSNSGLQSGSIFGSTAHEQKTAPFGSDSSQVSGSVPVAQKSGASGLTPTTSDLKIDDNIPTTSGSSFGEKVKQFNSMGSSASFGTSPFDALKSNGNIKPKTGTLFDDSSDNLSFGDLGLENTKSGLAEKPTSLFPVTTEVKTSAVLSESAGGTEDGESMERPADESSNELVDETDEESAVDSAEESVNESEPAERSAEKAAFHPLNDASKEAFDDESATKSTHVCDADPADKPDVALNEKNISVPMQSPKAVEKLIQKLKQEAVEENSSSASDWETVEEGEQEEYKGKTEVKKNTKQDVEKVLEDDDIINTAPDSNEEEFEVAEESEFEEIFVPERQKRILPDVLVFSGFQPPLAPEAEESQRLYQSLVQNTCALMEVLGSNRDLLCEFIDEQGEIFEDFEENTDLWTVAESQVINDWYDAEKPVVELKLKQLRELEGEVQQVIEQTEDSFKQKMVVDHLMAQLAVSLRERVDEKTRPLEYNMSEARTLLRKKFNALKALRDLAISKLMILKASVFDADEIAENTEKVLFAINEKIMDHLSSFDELKSQVDEVKIVGAIESSSGVGNVRKKWDLAQGRTNALQMVRVEVE